MLKKFTIVSVLLLLSVGCQSTQPSDVNTSNNFIYEPGDREEFIFAKLAPQLQKYGYGDVCFKRPIKSVTLECSQDKLDYDYVGKRGYYTNDPVSRDKRHNRIRKAILENGKVLYLVKSDEYRHVGNYIISLEEHLVRTSPLSQKKFSYKPGDREEFIFAKLAPQLQKYGYDDVCFEFPLMSVYRNCSQDKLDYDDYVGKRGYYANDPATTNKNHIIRKATLENGKVLYLVKSDTLHHVGDDFISLEEHLEITAFSPQPIVEGSNVTVTGYSNLNRGDLSVSSQNKHTYSKAELEFIRDIAKSKPKYQGRIADLLSTLYIEYDDISGIATIKGIPQNNKSSYLSVKINVDSNKKATPLMSVYYEAKSWLFIHSFIVAADKFRWQSPKLNFKKDNSYRKIWEWNSFYLTSEANNALLKLAAAKKPIVRFRGSDYYNDYTLTPVQQKELNSLLELNELLNND